MEAWVAADGTLPSFRSSVGLLEYTLNNIDIMDMLHPLTPTTFELRTTFLNAYTHKDPKSLVGAVVHLEVQASAQFSIQSVTYATTHYSRAELPPEIASRILSGIIAYVTVALHLFQTHFHSSARIASMSEALLPMGHPVRQVLMPTELGAPNGVARALHALVGTDGIFATTGPFTYEGLYALTREDVPLRTNFPASTHRIGADYHVWWGYIVQTMSHVVDVLYPPGTSLDPAAYTWLFNLGLLEATPDHRKALVLVMSSVFMTQVRHNFMSSHIFGHISRYKAILDVREVNISETFLTILTGQATNLRWVPITRDFSSNIDHAAARSVMRTFYSGLQTLPVHHQLSRAHGIEASTGM
jgi:hypothetical protein